MDDADYHEVFPTRWEITAAYAICCAKCHETKLAKYFRRRLTRAQAESRGYFGERPMYVESIYCRPCQPGHYKPSKMSANAIVDAARNGVVSITRAKIDMENNRKRASRKMGLAAAQRWARWKEAPWLHVRSKIADELIYVTHALSYEKTLTPVRETSTPLSDFMREYQAVLHRLRGRCAILARTQAKAEPDAQTLTWRSFMGDKEFFALSEAWESVPLERRARLRRIPACLNIANRNVSLLADYLAPDQAAKHRREQADRAHATSVKE